MINKTKYLPKPENSIRVASFNLLNKALNMETRLNSLIEELEVINPDVLCLQEVIETKDYPVLERLSEELGFVTYFTKRETKGAFGEELSGPAILSKTQEEHFSILDQSGIGINSSLPQLPILTSSFMHNGYKIYVINTHLTWGSHSTGIRTRQAERISQYARGIREIEPQAVILLTGDFNCVEESTTIRFLKGLEETHTGENTLWVDAWAASGTPENAITSDPTFPLSLGTAKMFGVAHTDFTPKRRIDYIFSYEWCYGKAGYPLTFGRFADDRNIEISDHFGIYSDISLPTLN
jgi:endonuclease/exonuclease/phosphatase family metal-dependent hydrolase